MSTQGKNVFWFFRAFRDLSRECCAAKLFSKHMKIEDQVVFLPSMQLLSVMDIILIMCGKLIVELYVVFDWK